MTVTTTRVDEDTCYREIPCPCCDECSDNDCCCDFIFPLKSCYWSEAAHYLRIELVNEEEESYCPAISVPDVFLSTFDQTDPVRSAYMRPQPNPPAGTCVWWQSDDGTSYPFPGSAQLKFRNGSACENAPDGPGTVVFKLYCVQNPILGTPDPGAQYKIDCNPTYGFGLQVDYNNSACDEILGGSNGPKDNANYISLPGVGKLHLPYKEPICIPADPHNPCEPNKGQFELRYRIEAPHWKGLLFPYQCTCCEPNKFYIVKISLNQDVVETPKLLNPSCCGPPTPPPSPSPPPPLPPPPGP
jgi:hypothetical protein